MPPSAGGSSAHSFGSFSPILKTPAAKRGSRAAAAAVDAWSDCTPPSGDAAPSPARIGHTAVLVGEWMVLYGGVLAGAPERDLNRYLQRATRLDLEGLDALLEEPEFELPVGPT